MPFFTTGPRKPATFKQRVARIVNWGLFSVEGALSGINSTRYKIERLRADSQASLTREETYELLKAERSLINARIALEDARWQLRMFNVMRGKKS